MPKEDGKLISDGTVAILKEAKKGENNMKIGKCENVKIDICQVIGLCVTLCFSVKLCVIKY